MGALVRLDNRDWSDHAFPADNEGCAVWKALCGEAVPADHIEPSLSNVPDCVPCALAMGTVLGDRVEAEFAKGFGTAGQDDHEAQ